MIQKDGVDIEMLPDDWKRTGHVIQACDFPLESLFLRSLYKGKLKPLIETKSKGNSNIEYYAEFRKFNVISLAWPNIVENRIFSIDTEYNDINKYKGIS